MKSRQHLAAAVFLLGFATAAVAQDTNTVYQNNFQTAALGKVPDDLQVLDGGFEVQQDADNKFVELPGAPLDTFSFLFGPTQKDQVIAAARVYGTAKGRRYPTFALGLNGVGGYRLQVDPAKKELQFIRNDQTVAAVPFNWVSGKWTHLELAVLKAGATWSIRGKAWTEGTPEPKDWMITAEEKKDLAAGRAVLYGCPFAGTPIRFDDLEVKNAH